MSSRRSDVRPSVMSLYLLSFHVVSGEKSSGGSGLQSPISLISLRSTLERSIRDVKRSRKAGSLASTPALPSRKSERRWKYVYFRRPLRLGRDVFFHSTNRRLVRMLS